MREPELGKAIREARERFEMDRPALAKASGVDSRAITRLETRGSQIGEARVQAIALALGTTADALRGIQSAPPLEASIAGLLKAHGRSAVLRAIADAG